MSNAHIPGPWFQLTSDEKHSHISNTIAPQWAAPDHYVGEVTKQNAGLIAAAPDLLAACEAALRMIEHYPSDQRAAGLATVLQEAIAKAQGDQP